MVVFAPCICGISLKFTLINTSNLDSDSVTLKLNVNNTMHSFCILKASVLNCHCVFTILFLFLFTVLLIVKYETFNVCHRKVIIFETLNYI